MTDEKKPAQVSKAPPPITRLSGRGYSPLMVRRNPAIKPDWRCWPESRLVYGFQAVALSLNIDPESIKFSNSHNAVVGRFDAASFPDAATEAEFVKRYRLIESMPIRNPETLARFLPALSAFELPPELEALAQKPDKPLAPEIPAAPSGAPENKPETTEHESPEQYRTRLLHRHNELKASGEKAPTQKLAEEENITDGRVRELLRDAKSNTAKKTKASISLIGQLAAASNKKR